MSLHRLSAIRPIVRIALLLPLALGACAPEKMSPVEWWHSLEGGRIAEDRPPPPNPDAPYPNLSTVPPRPPAPDPKQRATLAGGLVADRTNAQYAASLAPLPASPGPAVRPVQPTPRPEGGETSSASLPAAAAPPPPKPAPGQTIGPLGPPQLPLPNVPVTPPRRAPTQAVQAAPLDALTSAPAPAPDTAAKPATPAGAPSAITPADIPSGQASAAQVGAGTPAAPVASLPPIPDAPPAPPVFAGVSSVTVPTPAPTPPPPAPVVPVFNPGAPVLVPFAPGSSTIPVQSLAALKVLSRQVGGGAVAVTGFGDVDSSDAVVQANAVPLALSRARAIAATLLASGVPAASIRVNAEAEGRGGAARLTN